MSRLLSSIRTFVGKAGCWYVLFRLHLLGHNINVNNTWASWELWKYQSTSRCHWSHVIHFYRSKAIRAYRCAPHCFTASLPWYPPIAEEAHAYEMSFSIAGTHFAAVLRKSFVGIGWFHPWCDLGWYVLRRRRSNMGGGDPHAGNREKLYNIFFVPFFRTLPVIDEPATSFIGFSCGLA